MGCRLAKEITLDHLGKKNMNLPPVPFQKCPSCNSPQQCYCESAEQQHITQRSRIPCPDVLLSLLPSYNLTAPLQSSHTGKKNLHPKHPPAPETGMSPSEEISSPIDLLSCGPCDDAEKMHSGDLQNDSLICAVSTAQEPGRGWRSPECRNGSTGRHWCWVRGSQPCCSTAALWAAGAGSIELTLCAVAPAPDEPKAQPKQLGSGLARGIEMTWQRGNLPWYLTGSPDWLPSRC